MTREDTRLDLVIWCVDQEQRTAVGESICKQLAGNEHFVNNDIVVNYTDSTDTFVTVSVAADLPFSLSIESDGNDVNVKINNLGGNKNV